MGTGDICEVTMDENGRVILPQEMLKQLYFEAGGQFFAYRADRSIMMKTIDAPFVKGKDRKKAEMRDCSVEYTEEEIEAIVNEAVKSARAELRAAKGIQ